MKKILLVLYIFLPFFVFAQKDSIYNPKSLPIAADGYRLKFTIQQTILPGSLLIAGSLLTSSHPNSFKNKVKDYRNAHYPNFKTKIDNYLEFTPLVLSYGLEFCGMKPRHDILQRSLIIAKSQIISNSVSNILKYTTKNLRPDESTYNSFPSGHTIQAFSMATVLSVEFGKKYKWVPFASYAIATSVGILRILNNRHYISDVMAGAGIGIFSTKIVYWTHRYRWGKKQDVQK